jgi:hypothetical protein
MQAVFNPPMASDGGGKRVGGREAEQEIAGFPAHFVFDPSFGSHHANPSEAFPFLLRVQIRQDLWLVDCPVLSYFQPTMALFDQANRLLLPPDKTVFLGQSKGGFHLLVQISLVVFECQSVVALLLDNLSGNLDLGPHRINRDNAARQRQLP